MSNHERHSITAIVHTSLMAVTSSVETSPWHQEVPVVFPQVVWARIHPHTPKNLPKPIACPVLGPPTEEVSTPVDQHWQKHRERLSEVHPPHSQYNLGCLPGFYTSEGIIQPPDFPINGYILEGYQWVIHAQPGGSREGEERRKWGDARHQPGHAWAWPG